jgi:ankyrin repeat protein
MAFDNWAKHQEMVTLILDRGADPNLVDKVFVLPISISCGNES